MGKAFLRIGARLLALAVTLYAANALGGMAIIAFAQEIKASPEIGTAIIVANAAINLMLLWYACSSRLGAVLDRVPALRKEVVHA